MPPDTARRYFFDLIDEQAESLGDKPFILFEDQKISFREFQKSTCRVSNAFEGLGAKAGEGVAILMANCPEYVSLFYGVPRMGLYTVPVNTALKGDGLKYILTHSDVKYLVVDDILLPRVEKLGLPVAAINKILVRLTTEDKIPDGMFDFNQLITSASDDKPSHTVDPSGINYLMYTSGTTGFPKGVVYRNWAQNPDGIRALATWTTTPDDILYACLPLFHANALILSVGFALGTGVPLGIEKRFSASGLWDSVRRFGATQFNALGAMIPILMKQPEKANDTDNPVTTVVSAACPANMWEAFEKRFDVKIKEFYGAVDGGGVMTSNDGSAPVGSVGKVMGNRPWKLVDDEGKEVPQGEPGELISKVASKTSKAVEYYKNEEASEKKVQGDWIHSGDFFYADKDGNLYFVDRKNDAMRRRGENISSYEVENTIEKHEGVAECAAFGVPSDLGENEVMIWIQPKKNVNLDLKELMHYCTENMAYFMVPRYVDIVEEIPRTGTLRAQKTDMKKRGVTDRTWDREKEMPDFKPSR